jgi:hypothetical protein
MYREFFCLKFPLQAGLARFSPSPKLLLILFIKLEKIMKKTVIFLLLFSLLISTTVSFSIIIKSNAIKSQICAKNKEEERSVNKNEK